MEPTSTLDHSPPPDSTPGTEPCSNDLIHSFQQTYQPQPGCPFFVVTPVEIRNRIFQFALTSCENPSRPYETDSYWYRPGYRCHKHGAVGLIQTCKLIYLETWALPAYLNEFVFYLGHGPAEAQSPSLLLPKLSPYQCDIMQHVHFFAQLPMLESSWAAISRIPQLRPKKITLTIRHTDWWGWEDDEPLDISPRMNRDRVQRHLESAEDGEYQSGTAIWTFYTKLIENEWGRQFKNIEGLEELVIELETVERKKAQLDEIVAQGRGWRFDLGDGRMLFREEYSIRSYSWMGSTKFDNRRPEQVPVGPAVAPTDPQNNVPLASPSPSATPPDQDDAPAVPVGSQDNPGINSPNQDADVLTSAPPSADPTVDDPTVTSIPADPAATQVEQVPGLTLPMYVVVMKWFPHRLWPKAQGSRLG